MWSQLPRTSWRWCNWMNWSLNHPIWIVTKAFSYPSLGVCPKILLCIPNMISICHVKWLKYLVNSTWTHSYSMPLLVSSQHRSSKVPRGIRWEWAIELQKWITQKDKRVPHNKIVSQYHTISLWQIFFFFWLACYDFYVIKISVMKL